jgi:hypothetical protein
VVFVYSSSSPGGRGVRRGKIQKTGLWLPGEKVKTGRGYLAEKIAKRPRGFVDREKIQKPSVSYSSSGEIARLVLYSSCGVPGKKAKTGVWLPGEKIKPGVVTWPKKS